MLLRGVELFIEAIAAGLVVVFTLLILADVVCRYLLHIPIAWVSELSVFLFQWTVFLGAILALRKGLHFGVGLVLARVWPRLAAPLGITVAAITCAVSLMLLALAIRMAAQTWDATYSTLDISHGWAYVAVAICAGFMAVFAVEQGFDLLRSPKASNDR